MSVFFPCVDCFFSNCLLAMFFPSRIRFQNKSLNESTDISYQSPFSGDSSDMKNFKKFCMSKNRT